MKKTPWIIGMVLVGCAAATACVTAPYPPVARAPVAPSYAPPGGSDQPFYEDLAPYGRWVYAQGPGWVWSPYNVQADWRPYLAGRWVFTDYGWTWASDEAFGSIVYHYGRWYEDASYGWVWVPGTEWGPAWVAWHEGGGYVGWAPLPWGVHVEAGVGLGWGGINVAIQPSSWCFVSARNLVDPALRQRIEPPSRNMTLVQVTRNITNYTYIDNRVVNEGVKPEAIGRAVGHTIPRYRLADADSNEASRGGKVRGQDFVMFRPDPGRGRKWQGRGVPPGHDENRQPRDLRQPAPNEPAGAPGQSAPSQTGTQPGQTPPAQAPSNQGQANQPANQPPANQGQGRDSDHGRGHGKFFEKFLKKDSPRGAQQNSPPGQSGTNPGQQSAPPGQTSVPPGQASTPPGQRSTPPGQQSAQPGQQTAPGQQSVPSAQQQPPQQPPAPGQQFAPGRQPASAPPAGASASGAGSDKAQAEKARGRGPNKGDSKPGKPKPDAAKTDGSDSDKSKPDKQDSGH